MRRFFAFSLLVFFLALPSALAESFGVAMLGSNEIPAGDPDGLGFADLILDGTTLSYAVLVFNVERPSAMHIHPGLRGQTGSPIITLTAPFVRHEGCPSLGTTLCGERFVSIGQMQIPAETADELIGSPSNFYLNAHNGAHPGGAVRGQVQFARYLPVVGQTPGAVQTNWFTRFAVLNRSVNRSSDWNIEFIPQSPIGSTTRFNTAQTALGALSLSATTNFPVAQFTGLGTARILSDQPIAVSAAVYNGAAGARGDLGFALHGKALEDARTSGILIDLTTSSAADLQAKRGHRTNVGYFNPQFHEVEASFRAFGHDGATLGENVITIPPLSMVQVPIFDLIASVPASARVQDAFWVSWVASSPIFVYAAVVNNMTGDPEFRD